MKTEKVREREREREETEKVEVRNLVERKILRGVMMRGDGRVYVINWIIDDGFVGLTCVEN